MSKQTLMGISVVLMLVLVAFYLSLSMEISSAREIADEASSAAEELRLENEELRTEVDDLSLRLEEVEGRSQSSYYPYGY
jgi:predicted nuclease with TOPRIM domain